MIKYSGQLLNVNENNSFRMGLVMSGETSCQNKVENFTRGIGNRGKLVSLGAGLIVAKRETGLKDD